MRYKFHQKMRLHFGLKFTSSDGTVNRRTS
jgi:hypothetical protein